MIADFARAHIPVPLDRERILCFDHKATFLLMRRYGTRPTDALYEPGDGKSRQIQIRDIDALAFFLWAGLQRDAEDAGETLTLEQACEFIDPLTCDSIFNALLAALNRPLHRKNAEPAEPKGEQAGESASPKSSTGKRRSASHAEGSD